MLPLRKPLKSGGVIVYLAQARHSSYGRDSLKLLRGSVASLADNYLRLTNPRDDVLFLHFGEVPTSEQHSLVRLCGVDIHARFALVPSNYSTLPPGTTPMEKWQHPKKFSVGYRHMIRLYTIGIWHIVAAEGYEYVMRMDEDSVILSPIQYNIFERMRSRGIEYMYRLASWEGIPGFSPDSFHRFISRFLINRTIAPEWLLDSCVHRSVHNFSTFNCGNVYGFYNNFFATRVGFWMRDDVQDFLRHADQSHHIYVHRCPPLPIHNCPSRCPPLFLFATPAPFRWNDILWQSAAVQIFLPPYRVEMNRDFAYEHVTFGKINITVQLSSEMHDKNDSSSSTGSSRGKKRSAVTTKVSTRCITYGGLVLGERGNQSAAMARLRSLIQMPMCRETTAKRRQIRACLVSDFTGTRAILVGTVSNQGAHCSHREPRPFYCAGNATSGDYPMPSQQAQDSLARTKIPPQQSEPSKFRLHPAMIMHPTDRDNFRLDAECSCSPSWKTRTSDHKKCLLDMRTRELNNPVHAHVQQRNH